VLTNADRDEPVVAGGFVSEFSMILLDTRELVVEVARPHQHAHRFAVEAMRP